MTTMLMLVFIKKKYHGEGMLYFTWTIDMIEWEIACSQMKLMTCSSLAVKCFLYGNSRKLFLYIVQ